MRRQVYKVIQSQIDKDIQYNPSNIPRRFFMELNQIILKYVCQGKSTNY